MKTAPTHPTAEVCFEWDGMGWKDWREQGVEAVLTTFKMLASHYVHIGPNCWKLIGGSMFVLFLLQLYQQLYLLYQLSHYVRVWGSRGRQLPSTA
jgi:hypothetical protein